MSDWEDSFADRMRNRALQRMQKIPLMKSTTNDTSEEPVSKKRNILTHCTESLDKQNIDNVVFSLTPIKPVIAEHLTIRKSLVVDTMECNVPEVFVLTNSKRKVFAEEQTTENKKEDVYVKHCKNRLANLAGKFKQFEEEDSHVPRRPLAENNKQVPVKRRSDEYEPAKGDVSTTKNAKSGSNVKKESNNAHVFVRPPEPSVKQSPSRKITPNKTVLDQSVVNTLESQGFTKTVSDVHSAYDFKTARNAFDKETEASPSNRTPKYGKTEPAKTIAFKVDKSEPPKKVESPRKVVSVFNKPEPTYKKEFNSPKKVDDKGISKLHSNSKYQSNVFVQNVKKVNENEDSDSADPCLLSVAERRRLFEKRMFGTDNIPTSSSNVERTPKSNEIHSQMTQPTIDDSGSESYSTCESENYSNNSHASDSNFASESEIPMSEDEHSEFELECNVVTESKSHDECNEEPNISAYPVLQTIGQVKISSTPKPGCLYPSVSDLDGDADGDADDDVDNKIKNNETPKSPNSADSFEKELLHATDHIFSSYHSDISKNVFDTRKSNALTEAKDLVSTNDDISLLLSSPEARSSIRSVEGEDECDSKIETNDELDLRKRIRCLEEHVIKEKIKLTQAIRALKLCLSTSFLNSESHLEAEKLVLLSQLKIEAAQNEIDRMKVEKSVQPVGSTLNAVRGNVIISKIKLPVKMPNVQSDLRKDIYNNIMCVVKCGATVVATEVVSVLLNKLKHDTDGVYVEFPNSVTVSDVSSDFKIRIEVYNLMVEKKDETNSKHGPSKKDKKTSNSKNKKQNYLGREVVDRKNPHSSFTMIGHMIFSHKEIQRHQWILNNYDYHHTPLVGMILMQLKCNLTKITIQKHGFLTMYEVVSGYGAWSRNWFYLDGEKLSFWKYPEQETTQDPIGTFDLKKCITKDVTTVGYDIVFRPQTFMLQFDPPTYLQQFKGFTENRLLLSADNEEEKRTWCENLSDVLKSIRSWSSSEE